MINWFKKHGLYRHGPYQHSAHKLLHEGHSYAHLAYFGAVFWEGHGFYASMGGVLLLTSLAMLVLGVTDGE